MKKLCTSCNTINDIVGFDLTEKELHNLHQLNLSENLCKTCYTKELSALAETLKIELVPLNKQREITQIAYYDAYKSWKDKADLFQAIDYNINIIKHNQKKAVQASKKITMPKDTINIELLAKKILANLSMEQQEAIIRTFQANII